MSPMNRRTLLHVIGAASVAPLVGGPGGFEKFFDALGRIPEGNVDEAAIRAVMARYGMDVVGPPLFGLWRQQRG